MLSIIIVTNISLIHQLGKEFITILFIVFRTKKCLYRIDYSSKKLLCSFFALISTDSEMFHNSKAN